MNVFVMLALVGAAAVVPGLRALLTWLFVLPVFALFFGCAVWIVWFFLSGADALNLDAFEKSMAIGSVLSLLYVLTIKA